ncbi:hypothetical protein E2C01_072553 [Portunus trituberculatus]|uniref:Uncharacterized protein n=1 Tax=Portunus trituberculatus TaxID=210409 RepID=A0A5B7IB14_PORTR|nr:hypothetical protein [Portunus trituberculatus]
MWLRPFLPSFSPRRLPFPKDHSRVTYSTARRSMLSLCSSILRLEGRKARHATDGDTDDGGGDFIK